MLSCAHIQAAGYSPEYPASAENSAVSRHRGNLKFMRSAGILQYRKEKNTEMSKTLSERLKDEMFGGISASKHIVCRDCLFVERTPENSYCKIYTGKTGMKPHNVYFLGGPCRFRKTADDLEKS